MLPFAERNVCGEGEASTGAVARYLGQLASAKGDVGEAVDRFEYALGENERMGARPWLAHTRQDLGALLLVTGRTADRGRAHDLLRAALATYRELGMYPYAARLEEGVL